MPLVMPENFSRSSTSGDLVDAGAASAASDVGRMIESGAELPNLDRRGRRRCRPRHRCWHAGENSHDRDPASNGRDASPVPPVLDDGVPPTQGPS